MIMYEAAQRFVPAGRIRDLTDLAHHTTRNEGIDETMRVVEGRAGTIEVG